MVRMEMSIQFGTIQKASEEVTARFLLRGSFFPSRLWGTHFQPSAMAAKAEKKECRLVEDGAVPNPRLRHGQGWENRDSLSSYESKNTIKKVRAMSVPLTTRDLPKVV